MLSIAHLVDLIETNSDLADPEAVGPVRVTITTQPRFRGITATNPLHLIWSEGICSGEHTLFEREPRAARQLCRECPVQQACLEYAVSKRETGIWGGLDETERARLRK